VGFVVIAVEILKHTNNPLARLMQEIRRRTRIFDVFPDGKSALMLIAARQRHFAVSEWGTRHYFQMNRLAKVVAFADSVL